jgi:hypothetical protein
VRLLVEDGHHNTERVTYDHAAVMLSRVRSKALRVLDRPGRRGR